MDKQLLLLGLLRQHQMHGYELVSFIEGRMSACTDMKKPTAYFLLDKLAQEGMVQAHVEREGNRPARNVFRITAAGETKFQRLLRDNLAGYDLPPFTSDVALAFLDVLDPAEVRELLRQRRDTIEVRLAEARRAPAHPGSTQLLVDHQLHYLTSELAWVNTVIDRVSDGAKSPRRKSRAAQKHDSQRKGEK